MSPTPNTLTTTVVAVAGKCEGGSCNVLDLCAKMLTVAFGKEVTPGALRQLVPAGERIPHVETAFNWPQGVALVEHPDYHGVRTVYLYDHREKLVVGEPLPSADGIEGVLHDVPPGAEPDAEETKRKVAAAISGNHPKIAPDTMLTITLPGIARTEGDEPYRLRMTLGEAARLYSIERLTPEQAGEIAKGGEATFHDQATNQDVMVRLADPDAAAFDGSADGQVAEREHEPA